MSDIRNIAIKYICVPFTQREALKNFFFVILIAIIFFSKGDKIFYMG